MADLLSGAASVAGLASLGLTVTGGIEKYANALNCRADDLESVRRRTQVLRNTVVFVDDVQSQMQLGHRQHPSVATVDEAIRVCRAELIDLEDLVVALSGCSTTTSWRSKLKDTRKTLTYAFDRPKVEQLARKLEHTIQIVQLSLHGLGLDLSRLQAYKLDLIETTSCESASDVKSILPSVKDRLDQIEGRLSASMESVKLEGLKGNQLLQQKVSDGLSGLESRVVDHLLGRLMGTDPSRAVSWLASKPAVLRELFEETAKSPNIRPSTTVGKSECQRIPALRASWICVCGHRRRIQKRDTPPGLFRIYSEVSVRSHKSYCPLSRAKFTEERSTKLGIRFYGLVYLMNVVLNISFHVTSGAGGRSISPTFTYYPTVDRKSDPGFRVMDGMPLDFITHTMHCHGRCSSCMVTIGKMTLKKIKELVFAGKTSPKAVDAENQSLIHVIMTSFSGFPLAYDDESEVLETGLIELGVPPESYDIRGNTPVGIISRYLDDCTLWIAQLLLDAQTDLSPVSLRDDFSLSDHPRFVALLEKSAKLAEVYECGPLTTAILDDDASEVAELIARYPDSMQEENLLRQTPLHIAVHKPHRLFLLLPTSSFTLLDKQDSAGFSPLDYALAESENADRHIQSADNNGACRSDCDCTRSLDLILEAALEFPQILEPHRELGDGVGSEKAYDAYERYMENCRDKLRLETLQALKEAGMKPAKATLTPFPGTYEEGIIESTRGPGIDKPSLTDRWRICRQFYLHHQKRKSTRAPARQGLIHVGPVSASLAPNESLGFVKGLPNLGDDPNCGLRMFQNRPSHSLTRAGHGKSHYASFDLGKKLGLDTSQVSALDDSFFSRHLESLLLKNAADHCDCACSERGCTQFVYFLKGFVAFLQPPARGPGTSSQLLARSETMARIGPRVSADHHRAAVRFFAFEALGLAHTCCNASRICGSEGPGRPFRGDAGGVQGGEEAMLRELDLHVEEYENEFRRIIANAGSFLSPSYTNAVAGIPGLSPSEIESRSIGSPKPVNPEVGNGHEANDPFWQFWVEYWQTRIMEVLK